MGGGYQHDSEGMYAVCYGFLEHFNSGSSFEGNTQNGYLQLILNVTRSNLSKFLVPQPPPAHIQMAKEPFEAASRSCC